ncbi:MAG: hypothetical protein EZS28_001159 [Streblomastix strix]|uniref:Uncharacterized protein n=1 Tax=Streblomastix strix TaxID=222440 RepID=A0A5J4X7X6_9EUKA|nr:MAG: hypothetical protein EZS28_001159 [Streblomastix strix]
MVQPFVLQILLTQIYAGNQQKPKGVHVQLKYFGIMEKYDDVLESDDENLEQYINQVKEWLMVMGQSQTDVDDALQKFMEVDYLKNLDLIEMQKYSNHEIPPNFLIDLAEDKNKHNILQKIAQDMPIDTIQEHVSYHWQHWIGLESEIII